MGDIFRYVTTNRELVTEIGNFLTKGESVVALGHRNSGKIFLKDRVKKVLDEQQLGPVISVRFQGEQSLASTSEAFQRICTGVREIDGEDFSQEMEGRELLAPLLKVGEKTGKMPIMLASNVDAMSTLIARQFLQEVRSAVDSRKLVVLLTGAYDLRELVWGPNSEFNVAHHFVLQGFGYEYFTELMESYANALNLRFDSSDAQEELWRITGGNGYALRVLLWVIVEWRTRNRNSNEPLQADLIRSWAKRTPVMGPDEAHLLRSAIRLIPLEPEVWESLRRLTVDKQAPLKDPNGPPEALTLSGIAQRTEDGLMKFASPLAEELVCRYYDDLRLGDLYGRAGKWSEAFDFYRKVDPPRRLRPSSSDDRPDVDAVIRSLCAFLHANAESGPEDVCHFFALGCRYVLGFPEVAFWRKKAEQVNKMDQEWVPLFPEYSASSPGKEAAVKTLKDATFRPGPIPVADNWQRSAFALVLETAGRDLYDAVLVGDFETRLPVSPQREKFFNELACHFLQAHSHATAVERDRHRLRLRNGQASIINGILSRLGQDVLNVGDILQRAAEGLRALGYRRIGFCLVDPKNQRIEGMLDASDDPSVNLAKMTNWPLGGEYVNVHQQVIREGRTVVVDDGWSHPLTNKDAVAAGRLRAFAVIPLLDYSDCAIGTILVERQDQSAPSQDEVQNFLQFGQQLAAVIEQGERVNLMQGSLDQIPEPLLIFDPMRRVRYANRTASEFLTVAAGWKGRNEAPPLPETEDFSISADRVLEGRRSFRNFVGLGKDRHYHGALLSAPILDWRQRVVGALAHIGDLNYVFQVFWAFENAAKASDMESLLQTLLQAMSRFGHKWGRIYLVEGEGKSKSLVSKLAFGFMNKDDPVRLSWRTDAPYWVCLDRQEPVIFFRDQESASPTSMKDPELILISEGNFPSFAEKPGNYCLDFPLVTSGRGLGKITIEINRDYTPEHHEFLKVLCEMASGLLEAFLRRELDSERKEGRIRAEAAHLSLAHFSHNIATRFANLDPMIARYRRLENDCPGLKQINSELEEGYRGILSVVNEAKHKLQIAHPDLRHVNATAYFRREMTRLVRERLSLETSPDAVWIRADESLLTGALSEIVQNAKEAAHDPESLHIHAAVAKVEHGGRQFVQFVIEDNGPGVEESYKERVFEDFFTHHPGREPGTGLGLSLVRRVFEAHRGWVRESGVYGQGARFELEIPEAMRHAPELED